MKSLKSTLTDCIEDLKDFDFSKEGFCGDTLTEKMNEYPFMLTLHGMDRFRLSVYINESMREFYGLGENDQSHQNMFFYLKTFHPSTYHVLVQSYQFFNRNSLGFFEQDYLLKNSKGLYEQVYGVSKTLAWDSKGMPSYALSLTCPSKTYSLFSALQLFDLHHLSNRESECLPLLVKGLTNGQIASEMNVSERTVEKHVSNILSHAKVPNRNSFFQQLHSSL
ncbi:LuxR C-terminal-related transcriptional regulator [Rubritalea sp.]|uniref:LuxR C-terminal-related transcriptional regulator n=1 Tax=Rubritalea sp. TaxID=2109375 RepID=UPI003EF553B9